MGFQKDIEFKGTGIVLGYWRVNCVTTDIELDQTKCRVGGYISKADALAGKKSIHSLHFEWNGPSNPIHMDTDPNDYKSLIESKVVAEPPLLAPTGPLVGATIVSDLPD